MDVLAHVIIIVTRLVKVTAVLVVIQCARAVVTALARVLALKVVWALVLILVWVIVMAIPNNNPGFTI